MSSGSDKSSRPDCGQSDRPILDAFWRGVEMTGKKPHEVHGDGIPCVKCESFNTKHYFNAGCRVGECSPYDEHWYKCQDCGESFG